MAPRDMHVVNRPLLLPLCTQHSAEGISLATWWMQLIGFTTTSLYNFAKGFPVSTYMENITLSFQSAVILFLTLSLQVTVTPASFGRPPLLSHTEYCMPTCARCSSPKDAHTQCSNPAP